MAAPRIQAWWLRSWESWAVLGLGLLLTGAVWCLVTAQAERLARERFREQARELADAIGGRLAAYEQLLRGGVALMDATGGRIGRTEWRSYVAALRVEERYPGIQGIGYAMRVAPFALGTHEEAVRAEGFHTYRVTPPGPRPDYFPTVYLEPFTSRNLRAFGYDMFAEPVRQDAMARARDHGTPAATGKVRLVQETEEDVQAGILLYLPVYDRHRPLDGTAERRAALRGFVYSPFRMADLMRTILKEGPFEDLDLAVHDGAGAAEGALLFERASGRDARFRDTRRIDVFGRTWTLRIAGAPAFEAGVASAAPRIILAAGGVITLLLVALMGSARRERDRMAELRRSFDALALARAEADEANAAKSRFLAAASHDLRQPMQTLGIYLHLIAEHPAAAPLGKLIASARDGFEATQRLLNALMDVAALESGGTRPRIATVDLAGLMTRIGEEIRVEADGRGLELRVAVCDARVETDPAMLERILRNLLHNALKYTPGGVVRLSGRARRDGVVLKVQDTGPGIPRDRQHLIFEDFYQIGNPERDRAKGLGLGLATVARLARLLGYRLRVLSRPGRGAVFIVEIPAAPGPADPASKG